ncbi:MAG: hypothetical protein IJ181_05680 [Acidaminococcaceae bacterium]|nr:hypothetical protein [Acidaminococcaceae bacterium]
MNDTETIGRPLDCKTLISILNRGAESALLLGAWCAMEAIAEEDPEGCVRLNPDVPMDASALGDFLHCPVETVENTIGLFRQLRKLTLEDGIIRINACAARKKAAASRERKRAQARQRQARYRERQKEQEGFAGQKAAAQREAAATESEDFSKGTAPKEVPPENGSSGDGPYWESVTVTQPVTVPVTQSVTQPVTLFGEEPQSPAASGSEEVGTTACNTPVTEPEATEKRKNQRKETSHNTSPDSLSCRKILDAWNRLGLKPCRDPGPSLQKKMKELLARYSTETIVEAIAGIAGCPFLLGKTARSRWSISLGWLLKPDNFAKVLSGKYRTFQKTGQYEVGRDYMDRTLCREGEAFPGWPAGNEVMVPSGSGSQEARDLPCHRNPVLEESARLLGLPY